MVVVHGFLSGLLHLVSSESTFHLLDVLETGRLLGCFRLDQVLLFDGVD